MVCNFELFHGFSFIFGQHLAYLPLPACEKNQAAIIAEMGLLKKHRNHSDSSIPNQAVRRILFGDCDPEGVVYTPRFADFAVEAALNFLAFWLGDTVARCIFEMGGLPLARAFSLEFLNLLTWGDEIDISVSVAEIRLHSFTLSVEATNASGQPAFQAN